MNKFTKAIAVLMLSVVAMIMSGCKPVEPDDGGNDNGQNDTIVDNSGNLNGHDYVDLGLPSGTLWASCNVGADHPGDRGVFFAWGETEPKGVYDWKSYKYGDCVNDCYVLNKYCTNSIFGFNGFVDSLTLLEPVDDAVRANWGEGWRMPTREECEELYQKTTWEWTTLDGVEGRLLTGRNGNSIFLPATGFYLDGELICTGLGIYWSSSLQTDCQVAGWSLHFDYENCHVCGTYERARGQCVRAVRVCQ
ncbi:MAG: hypothetical protein IKT08_03850 [Bacteroidales bacterium]|nr:hypothetical protein [Bacteroidales bacterium]